MLSLRILARTLKIGRKPDVEENSAYKEITEKVFKNVANLSEFEILDVLFWMRKFRQSNIKTHTIEEKVENKAFNFRNLVNLYFDVSYLKKGTEKIIQEIRTQLKNDSRILTPFACIQIIQAAANKNFALGSEYVLVSDTLKIV